MIPMQLHRLQEFVVPLGIAGELLEIQTFKRIIRNISFQG